MLHPSYTDLMEVVNSEVEKGDAPVVQSRYSIVLATAKRARQIIGGKEPLVRTRGKGIKPLSVAVDELYGSKIRILTEAEAEELQMQATQALEEIEKLKARAEKKKEEKMDADVEDDENIADTEVEELESEENTEE